jgi:hypothetical protein
MNENSDTASDPHQEAQVDLSRGAAASPASGLRSAGVAVAAGCLYLLLVDAAVETFLTGAPVRWIVGAAVAAYVALSVLLRRTLTVHTSASASLLVLLGLLALTAWLPGGPTVGMSMVRQPTSTVLLAATTLAILLAGWVVVRLKILPVAFRVVVGVLTLYGLAGLAWGIVVATPFPELFHGQGLWVRLPFWLQGAFIGGLVLLPAGVVILAVAAAVGMQGRRRWTDAVLATASSLALAVVVAGLVAPAATGSVAAGEVGTPARLAGPDEGGSNGPGLRRASTGSLQLPVPRAFDLSHVEPVHFAAALGKDPSRIFEYVRDHIAFDAYTGCLRGPRGTLLAMAGNSVDRAALLASLLVNSGYRVRYVRGSLPEALAQQLVASMWADRRGAAPVVPEGQKLPDLKAAGETLIDGIRRDTTLLRDALTKAGYPLPRESAVTAESLMKEARDHYWIEWLKDGAWAAMDPSFANATPGQVYAKAEETFDALPETLFHRVEIRIRVEEYSADKPSSREVLRYSAKAADLPGVDLVLTHQPENPTGQKPGPSGGLLSSAGEATGGGGQVKPFLLVQDRQITGLPFWLKATSTQKSGGFGDAIGGAEATASVPVATSESIDLAFIAPGGGKETVAREVFDLVGTPRRLKGDTLSAGEVAARSEARSIDDFTGAVYDLLITTGAIDATHLGNLAKSLPPAEGQPVDVVAGLRRIGITFSALSDALLSRIANAQGSVCRFYLDSPRVLIAELSGAAGTSRLSLDLRRDQARAVVTGFRREQLFFAHVLRGVADGTLERIVIGDVAGSSPDKDSPAAPVVSTSLLFERALAAKVPTVLLVGASAALGVEVPEGGRARIDEALAAGYLVLAPQGPVAVGGAPRFAWWQIDPSSGATLAVTDEGLHQATAEGVFVRYKNKVGIAFRVGTRYLPRSQIFGSAAEADAFFAELQQEMLRRGLNLVFSGWI